MTNNIFILNFGFNCKISLQRSFGKFTMMLDSLNDLEPDEFSNESKIIVDDYLADPKTESLLEVLVFLCLW